MPRIYDDMNDPHDFCKNCYKKVSKQQPWKQWYDEDPNGDNHPPYSDTDYTCDHCGKALSDKDNWI